MMGACDLFIKTKNRAIRQHGHIGITAEPGLHCSLHRPRDAFVITQTHGQIRAVFAAHRLAIGPRQIIRPNVQ